MVEQNDTVEGSSKVKKLQILLMLNRERIVYERVHRIVYYIMCTNICL